MIFEIYLMFSLLKAESTNYHPVMVGDSIVVIEQQKNATGKSFVHLHQNETTALNAARVVVKQEGGSVVTLLHAGGRNIVFNVQNQRYEFDPNRIFTDNGIKKTLLEFSAYTPDAHQEVKRLAHAITTFLPNGKIIAVHNNSTYSLKDYLPGHSLAADARKLATNSQHGYRNFYLVTKKHDYLRLKKLKFNSVLQSASAADDGSLSVFLSSRDYINVEAGYDQLSAQIKMLQHA